MCDTNQYKYKCLPAWPACNVEEVTVVSAPRSCQLIVFIYSSHSNPGKAEEAGKRRGLSHVPEPLPHLWPQEKRARLTDLIPCGASLAGCQHHKDPQCSGQKWTKNASVLGHAAIPGT